jgi:hypothetical protein
MANTISWGISYNTSWWGDAIQTSPSIIEKPDFFGSQFAMNERQPVEAVKCIADWIHIKALQDLKN